MRIAIPKEIMANERRVAATPDTVAKYRKQGHEVFVEAGAGVGIFASDEDYRAAGANVVPDVQKLFASGDLILKVKQPMFNQAVGKHEVEMMPKGAVLVTFLHPAAPESHEMVRLLRDRGITAFTMDGIPRITRAQSMDALTSMSTCTGYRAMLDAACHLPKFVPMIGTAIGAVKPAEVLVVGTGVVGLQAVATAKRLGAVVKSWDIREAARKEAGSLGAKADGFEVPAELAMAEGGYAKALPAEWLDRERAALAPVLARADIVILSALVPGEMAPILVTDEMVKAMRPGSVIVDVSIDQGGNCGLTDPGKNVVVHGVTISGIQNIPGRLPVHSTWLYAENICRYVENLFKGRTTPDMDDEIARSSLVTMGGKIHHRAALQAMGEA